MGIQFMLAARYLNGRKLRTFLTTLAVIFGVIQASTQVQDSSVSFAPKLATALIALRSGAPILPIGITGTEKMKGKTWPFRRPRVTVNIGKPFHLPPTGDKSTKEELAQLTDFIMGHIAEQLPVEYRGHYEKREKTISQ